MQVLKRGDQTARKAAKVAKKAKVLRDDDKAETSNLPRRIDVKRTTVLRASVPGSVWRQSPFRYEPRTFATEAEKLKDRFVEDDLQRESFSQFITNPILHMTYCVAGNPDDSKAKYFAAYLASLHLSKLGSHANVVWEVMYGGFQNPLLTTETSRSRPTMLILSNLTPHSSNTRLEKARDLLEYYADIPRVVVVAGEDPLSFMTTRLHLPVHGLAYFLDGIVRRKVEIE
jgi:hypothetical protein